MTRSRLSRAAVFLVLALGATSSLSAQEAVEGPDLTWTGNNGALHADYSFDWTSQYFFRGYLQENGGSIYQSTADLGIDLYDGDSTDISLSFGAWNSLHSRDTGSASTDSFVSKWYEADLYGGLGFTTGSWDYGASFTLYASPNGAFASIEEVSVYAAYDDSEMWGGDFALSPYVAFSRETHHRGGEEVAYMEFGVAYEPDLIDAVSISIPLTLGLSADDYYVDSTGEDDSLGFFDVGIDLSHAIDVSNIYGGWDIHGGVHFLTLGNAAEEANAGEGSEVIFSLGVSASY